MSKITIEEDAIGNPYRIKGSCQLYLPDCHPTEVITLARRQGYWQVDFSMSLVVDLEKSKEILRTINEAFSKIPDASL